jgi:hypothetical protein
MASDSLAPVGEHVYTSAVSTPLASPGLDGDDRLEVINGTEPDEAEEETSDGA